MVEKKEKAQELALGKDVDNKGNKINTNNAIKNISEEMPNDQLASKYEKRKGNNNNDLYSKYQDNQNKYNTDGNKQLNLSNKNTDNNNYYSNQKKNKNN